jgi:putative lipoprotein
MKRSLLAAAVVLAGCGRFQPAVKMDHPPPRLIEVGGTISIREMMGLPPGAIIEVKLLDVSLQDVEAQEIARDIIEAEGRQPPYRFSLSYHPKTIDPAHDYAVQARITVGGRLWFINDTRYPVITKNNPVRVDMILRRVGAQ